jgi:hypothetical protein
MRALTGISPVLGRLAFGRWLLLVKCVFPTEETMGSPSSPENFFYGCSCLMSLHKGHCDLRLATRPRESVLSLIRRVLDRANIY